MSDEDHGGVVRLGCRRFALRGTNGFAARRDPADALLETFYQAIATHPRIEPAVKRTIHERRVKSFTISPLFLQCADGMDRPVGALGGAPPGASLWMRWTALDAITLKAMDHVLEHTRFNGPLRIDGEELRIVSWRPVYPSPGQDRESYAELFARARPSATIALRFTSPFVFRRGHAVVPADEFAVRHFFGGYLERWSTFSPKEMEGLTVDQLNGALTLLSTTEIRAVKRPRLPSKMPGIAFDGVLSFQAEGDETLMKHIAALADYAWYCGTGTGTAWGLGQTERL